MDPVTQAARRVQRRLRLQRALEWAGGGLALGLLLSVPLLGLMKTGRLSLPEPRLWQLGGGLTLLGAAVGWRRNADLLQAAMRLDRAHTLRGLCSSALAFGALDSARRTPFMQACLARAAGVAAGLDPRAAAPLRLPRVARHLPVLGLGVLLLALVEVPRPTVHARLPPPPPELMAPEDLIALAEGLPELQENERQPQVLRSTAAELNALLEAMAERKLERIEALRALRKLEQRLRDGLPGDDADLRAALAELGRSLDRHRITESLARALSEGDAKQAAAQMRTLAQRVERTPKDGKGQRLLSKALKSAAREPRDKSHEALDRKRKELERLLKKKPKQDDGKAQQRRKRLLNKKRRQLEKLERQQRAAQQRRRELERLRRELGSSAQQLADGNPTAGAGGMRRAAEDLNRMGNQQQAQRRAGQLARRLGEAKELLRRGKRGQPGRGKQGRQGDQGKRGKGKPLSLSQLDGKARGKSPGQAKGGRKGGSQAGAEGQGKHGSRGKPGPSGGIPVMAPGGDGKTPIQLKQQGRAAAVTQSQAGQGAGQGGTPGKDGGDAKLGSTAVDSQLEGDKGRGPTRSEVILEAASRGFASRRYEKVHTEYRRHAESVLERDEVPAGYRFYVRRYFQLIRPREGNHE